MQLHEVVEVTQVIGAGNANKKLDEGWKLLAVVTANSAIAQNGVSQASKVAYVLGRTEKQDERPKPTEGWGK